MTPSSVSPALYRVFPAWREAGGGKLVAVFDPPGGQHRDWRPENTNWTAPLNVVVAGVNATDVTLRVFTARGEQGRSDAGAVAALTALQARGALPDALDLHMGGETVAAQLCGGEWLLHQGHVTVQAVHMDLSLLGLEGAPAWVSHAGEQTLVVQVPDVAAFVPDAAAIAAVNRAAHTTGLTVFQSAGPDEDSRADVGFRCFGPLKGFTEDAASSAMFAGLTGVLSAAGLLPGDADVIRGAQRMPGTPARLTAQFTPAADGARGVWVGGLAQQAGL